MNWLQDAIDPMAAELVSTIPKEDYFYEVKWDGIRAVITYNKGELTIRTRNKKDVTAQFPELHSPPFDVDNAVFDGEIICPDEHGRPSFPRIIKRVRTTNELKIKRLVTSHPAQCYLFDCLYLDNESLIDRPFWSRRESLSESLNPNDQYRLSETFKDGEQLFQAVKKQKIEGIIAKKRDGRYQLGKRSRSWQKIKVRHEIKCKIIGYTRGSGDRSNTFGALEVAEITEDGLIYRGKVGTGFTDKDLKDIYSLLTRLDNTDRPDIAPTSNKTIWIEPLLVAKISYSELNPNGTFRAPVFENLERL